ncbi:beta-hexosaminidase subunit alpha isoform X2 [Rhipicephalus sanguineus]|uniref:beta-hexosaminidase subunit alpha isoform X2 n=1 Tax=Rhipicephalus sanguineus TaxID=34632 RepID=UPI0020C5AAFD|nr:beta-hexosaminidase subunit alpha isoform X2 [Rhipicephalus sanguineus]
MTHRCCVPSVLLVSVLTCCLALASARVHGVHAGTDHSWRPRVVVPTQGEVWPQPLNQTKSWNTLSLDASTFSFQYEGPCFVVQQALKRYRREILFQNCTKPGSTRGAGRRNSRTLNLYSDGHLDILKVTVSHKCEDIPDHQMDESYAISMSSTEESFISARTVWGALRGLETFSQLVYSRDGVSWVVNETVIYDEPRFPHRGLLIDSSRHFLPLESIMDTLDAMSYNKMNVLHWHIVDDESFPYVSKTFPSMSEKGAYDPEIRVYRPSDVQHVISEAAARGIRVMAEFDTPGHTRSWGEAFPEILTSCYREMEPSGELGPIDPTTNATYAFLKELFAEVADVFPEQYIHLGGDEVDFRCWKSNPNITDFMEKIGIPGDYSKLEDFYIQRLLKIVQGVRKSYMVWQEVFDNKVEIAPDTVVHVWKENQEAELSSVTKAGYNALLSSCWYLDYISYSQDWKRYYGCDPHNFTGTPEQKSLVQGGEACIWGEYVDATNLISRTWPRASAVAERLWSPARVKYTKKTASRFEEQRCRMLR